MLSTVPTCTMNFIPLTMKLMGYFLPSLASFQKKKHLAVTALHSLPSMISAITGTIVNATEAVLRDKPRRIPRVTWDHRDWVHQRGVGQGCHGWVGIVRWQCWICIISILVLKGLPFLFLILFLGMYIPSSKTANKNKRKILNNRYNMSG